jgi:quinolinate synthase
LNEELAHYTSIETEEKAVEFMEGYCKLRSADYMRKIKGFDTNKNPFVVVASPEKSNAKK